MIETLQNISIHPLHKCSGLLENKDKFLKDTILNMFLDDMKSFGSNVNLAEFYFTKEEHNTLTLHMPKDLKDKIKDVLNKEGIVIKVDLN